MICTDCRDGGTCNAMANEASIDWIANRLRVMAKRSHFDCKGGTYCDCQHFVGAGMLERASDEAS